MGFKEHINNVIYKFAVEIESDEQQIKLLNQTIINAVEPLAPSYAQWYLEKFDFVKDTPATIYSKDDTDSHWTKNQEIFRHLYIDAESSLRMMGILGKAIPFNKNNTELVFLGDHKSINIPLEERTFWGLKHKTYSHQNSNLFFLTDNLLAIRTPQYHVQTGKPPYKDTIITLNK